MITSRLIRFQHARFLQILLFCFGFFFSFVLYVVMFLYANWPHRQIMLLWINRKNAEFPFSSQFIRIPPWLSKDLCANWTTAMKWLVCVGPNFFTNHKINRYLKHGHILFHAYCISLVAHFQWIIFKFCVEHLYAPNEMLFWTWHWITIICEFAYSTKLLFIIEFLELIPFFSINICFYWLDFFLFVVAILTRRACGFFRSTLVLCARKKEQIEISIRSK